MLFFVMCRVLAPQHRRFDCHLLRCRRTAQVLCFPQRCPQPFGLGGRATVARPPPPQNLSGGARLKLMYRLPQTFVVVTAEVSRSTPCVIRLWGTVRLTSVANSEKDLVTWTASSGRAVSEPIVLEKACVRQLASSRALSAMRASHGHDVGLRPAILVHGDPLGASVAHDLVSNMRQRFVTRSYYCRWLCVDPPEVKLQSLPALQHLESSPSYSPAPLPNSPERETDEGAIVERAAPLAEHIGVEQAGVVTHRISPHVLLEA